ncbi:gliding motility-associated ABC transporter permease subunit GldF [uncultured Eudoraea sp.]|uniref:gliding motility-associated ABC transporter permease subunit GldF n=1 Tax=uncultured Eudoraea sp. TaxID=1035614 RepID=UPI002615792D|nr:gliding motility-associated ABC transporter permease subunit GldF [uncultured Eudoraea sp.]
MLAIFKREILSFFTTPVGYLIIGFFLVLNGLFLWVFKGDFNIFEYGFADLSKFFLLTPWVFMFLIPAVTMKSFSEEKKTGTLELLFIKPLSLGQTVYGKFFGALFLVVIALIPTFIYSICISQLGTTQGNLDWGLIYGSYFGLFFLAMSYTAIGIFTSTITENQIVAFILALFVCFMLYYGFESVSTLFTDGEMAQFVISLGMKSHFEGISRGVLDSRDLVYFFTLSILFLFFAIVQLKHHSR